jgi:tetratricopeptide (TPR) repeat protein
LTAAPRRNIRRIMDDEVRRARALELWNQGAAFHLQGDFQSAITLYNQSIELCPTAEAHTYRGWAYRYLGRIDDAIAECMRAIEIDPSFGNPYNDIGAYLMARGEADAAVEWFEKAKRAARYEPRHFPYMNLARLYADKGLVMKAITELEGALRLQPGDPACLEMIERLRVALN